MITSGEHALSFLKELSFPRTSGSDKEHLAAEMISKEIQTTGLEPVLEAFTVSRQIPVTATFRLTEPEEVTYTVTGLIDAAPTSPEGEDADFYYIRNIDDISLREARDKFVLVNDRLGERDYEKLAKAGVRGILLMSGSIRDTEENSDLDTQRFRDSWKTHGSVPGFTIRIKDALDLLKRNPKRVHYSLQLENETVTSYNIVVNVPGTDLAEEAIAVGAHYDSTKFSYGAWDNGAGVVRVLALLSHLSANPPRRSVKVLFFGSEEVGLKGSHAYLIAHPELQERLLAMINIDVGGSYLGKEFVAVTGTPKAEHYIEGLLKEGGHSAAISSKVMSSDSIVFSDYGIPVIFFGQFPPAGGGYMHTRYDDISLISAEVLGEEIRFLLFLSDRLTQAERFPIERSIPKELQDKIIEYFGSGISLTEKRQKQNPQLGTVEK